MMARRLARIQCDFRTEAKAKMNMKIRTLLCLLVLVQLGFSPAVIAAEIDCFRFNPAAAVYVSANVSELLAVPDDRTSTISRVSFGDRTCVLATKDIAGKRWVLVGGYVRRSKDERIIGWLPVESIVYRTKMSRQRNIRAQIVEVNMGDYFAEYHVRRGGAFEVSQVISEHSCRKNEVPNEYGACEVLGIVRGHFYGQGNFVVAQSAQGDDSPGDIFKRLHNGILCSLHDGVLPEACQ